MVCDQVLAQLLEGVRRRLGPAAAWLAAGLGRLARGEALRSRLRLAALPLEGRYRGVSRAFRPELKGRLLDGNGAGERRVDDLFAGCFESVERALPLDRMLYVDTKVWLPDDILLKGDKMTMATGLELRVPFLDHELVEFAATLPANLKVRGRWGKVLLREAMRGRVPEPILKRSKKGFPVPTESWLRGQLKSFTRESILASDSACRLYLDSETLEKTVREHEEGRINRDQEIWTLIVFEFWHRMFIEKRLRPTAGCRGTSARALASA